MAVPLFSDTGNCTSSTRLASSTSCTPLARCWTFASDNGWESGEAMRLTLRDDLILTCVTITYKGHSADVPDVVVDTGSAKTLLSADYLAHIDLIPTPQDVLYTVRGVGGSEVVFARRVERVRVGERVVPNFEIEVGGMDYGFDISGILGMDFLLHTGAVIDLKDLELTFTQSIL